MKHSSVFLIVAALCGSTVQVHAQPNPGETPTPAEVDEARRRFQRGVDLFREGSFDSALAEFEKAQSLAPNYRVLYNIAQVQIERHDYIAASKLLEQFLKEGGNDIPAERREQLEQEIKGLRTRIAQVVVSANVDRAELLVDGVVVGQLPLDAPLQLNSGLRRLQARKDGYRASMRTLTVAGNETVQVQFDLQPLPRASSSSVAAPAQNDRMATGVSSGSVNTPLWISLVATGLSAGGAVTFALMTQSSKRKVDDELERFPADRAAVEDARDEAKRNALITDVCLGATAVAGGLSVYFALSGSSSTKEQPSARSGIFVRPMGTGLRVESRF
jgi:tetratricopeptide (TPR) repeat protein